MRPGLILLAPVLISSACPSHAFPRLVASGDAKDDDDRSCADKNENCAGWAATGECEANPSFMLASCADSCTHCRQGRPGEMRSREERLKRREMRATTTTAPTVWVRSYRHTRVVVVASACSDFGARRGPEEGGQTIDATMRRILRDFPQYAPRAVSRPGGPHGEGAPWVMSTAHVYTWSENIFQFGELEIDPAGGGISRLITNRTVRLRESCAVKPPRGQPSSVSSSIVHYNPRNPNKKQNMLHHVLPAEPNCLHSTRQSIHSRQLKSNFHSMRLAPGCELGERGGHCSGGAAAVRRVRDGLQLHWQLPERVWSAAIV
ncbi:hypothetical protein EMIHUDRAFT_227534 [Emiliania huxleyi CCMP1516]|uniref:ShKT domain-containing protein n=2 Tax=Emiliania huxleyi TaxID=2903 RepID=A0A0D3KHK4_EMIH1|nr:hypothetical protein EMIHUDRAFT_227534 [Emiliania huxleyi CCMP1516]EOD35239.1 hypothetical protein EMIHUDRAFT_227534 [Emiliania huxleyi CCMP1516]|eukprot:XP_005787668.1 hypothetical protein EMIHUDRAFT_227534 [Emiliania huxleyi CCMP1516]